MSAGTWPLASAGGAALIALNAAPSPAGYAGALPAFRAVHLTCPEQQALEPAATGCKRQRFIQCRHEVGAAVSGHDDGAACVAHAHRFAP